jgi:hypothetical protein
MNDQLPDNPHETLEHIREKMQRVAADYAEGRLNRAQFNAIYGHYSEQQTIIARIIERDPGNPAWRQVAAPGHTSFLRRYFESQVMFYVVFLHHNPRPIAAGGVEPEDARDRVVRQLRMLWDMPEIPVDGLARKMLDDGRCIVLAPGRHAVTVAIFSIAPSAHQFNLIRDTHSDFERANQIALERGYAPDKMVFPQRALIAD